MRFTFPQSFPFGDKLIALSAAHVIFDSKPASSIANPCSAKKQERRKGDKCNHHKGRSHDNPNWYYE
jgi:hypothetical protein